MAFTADALPLHRLLRRFSHLLVLTALIAVPLASPIHIRETLDFSITKWFIDNAGTASGERLQKFWIEQLSPALNYGYSPLVLKRFVWAILTLALAVTHVLWKVLPNRPPLSQDVREPRFTVSTLLLLGFVAWSGLSLVFWMPPVEGLENGRGGFTFGLESWTSMVMGCGFFLITSDLVRRRCWVFKGIGLLIAGAMVVALLAYGQQQGYTASFLTRWPPENVRNRMASLIGHNTGMSSYVMAGLVFSIALGLHAWRRIKFTTATALWVFWFLLAMTLVMAQSRAVLIILAVALPILLWALHRTMGLSPGRWAWIGGIVGFAAVIVLQVIPQSPLYNKAIPLLTRTKDLSVEKLKTETRLRMTVCSMPLVLEAPLQGHGFGSFQYVIPKAQAEYFRAHPDTMLVPTGLRSMHAHNEYLQTLVETGILGLGLALAALFFVLRAGWLAFSRTLRPDDIPVQIGLAVSIGCILAHAFVDFPLRVPAICIVLAWMLAVWAGGATIWLPRAGREGLLGSSMESGFGIDAIFGGGRTAASYVETPPAAEPGAAAPGAATRDAANPGDAPARRHPAIVWGPAVAVGALVFVGAIVSSSWYSRVLVCGVLHQRADRLNNTYLQGMSRYSDQQRFQLLQRAEDTIRSATILIPTDGDVALLNSFVKLSSSRELLRRYQDLSRSADPKVREKAETWRQAAITHLETTLKSIDRVLPELRYHQVFHLRGDARRMYASLTGERTLIDKVREDFETTVAYSPSYADGVRALIGLLDGEFPGDVAARRSALALLHKWNRPIFRQFYVIRGDRAMESDHYAEAAAIYKDLSDAVPDDTDLLAQLAAALIAAGELEKAEGVLTELGRAPVRSRLYETVSAGLSIKRKEWARALSYVDEAITRQGDTESYYLKAMRVVLLDRLGKRADADRERTDLMRRARRELDIYTEFANVYGQAFDDLPRAIEFIKMRMDAGRDTTPPRLFFVLARWEDQVNRKPEAAESLLREVLKRAPDNRPCREYLAKLLIDRATALQRQVPAPDPAELRRLLNEARQLHPENPAFTNRRGPEVPAATPATPATPATDS